MDSPASLLRVPLTCHPSTPGGDIVRRVEVGVYKDRDGTLSFEYSVDADLSRVRVPEESEPERVDGLWKHTCFEAFILSGGGPEYFELNFSPSGEWAAYRFSGYREGMQPLDIERVPFIGVRMRQRGFDVNAAVRLDPPDSPWPRRDRLALAAVIEDTEGRLTYWALRHPSARPDFHHPDAFTLELRA